MNCFQVVYWMPAPNLPGQQRKVEAYYCADHITHVFARLDGELKDDAFHVESVIEVGPIVACLDENGKARSI